MVTSVLANLTFVLGAKISARPDPGGLPGSSVAERLVNGLYFYVLLAILVGLLVSVGVWVLASRSQNYHHAAVGRNGTIVAGLAALVAGAGPALVNFFVEAGQQVK